MDIVAWHELRHKSAQEIVSMFPELSLADVEAALAYYLEHREEIDQDFRQDEQTANEMIARHPLKTNDEERWQKQLAHDLYIDRLGDARKLTKEQVSELEARIDQDPDDLDVRIQLFGYYGRRADKMEKDGFCRQVLWFIDNHPEHFCASESFTVSSKRHYNKARKHWLKQWKRMQARRKYWPMQETFLSAILGKLMISNWESKCWDRHQNLNLTNQTGCVI